MIKKLITLLFTAGIILVLILAFLYLFRNPLCRKALLTAIPMASGCQAEIGRAELFPLQGRLVITDLRIANPEGYESDHMLQTKRLEIMFKPDSLAQGLIEITDMNMTGTNLVCELSTNGFNVDAFEQRTAEFLRKNLAFLKVKADNINIADGEIKTGLSSLGGAGVTLPLEEIRIRNIGRAQGGVPPAEAFQAVFSQLTAKVPKAMLEKSLGDLNKSLESGLDSAAQGLKDGLESILNKLDSLVPSP